MIFSSFGSGSGSSDALFTTAVTADTGCAITGSDFCSSYVGGSYNGSACSSVIITP